MLYVNSFYVQWGQFGFQQNPYDVILPISSLPLEAVANDMSHDVVNERNPICLSTINYSQGNCTVTGWRIYWTYGTNGTATNNLIWAHWIVVCK